MNQSNSYLFKLLNLPDDGSISIDNVELIDDLKYVHISKPAIPTYCSHCSCRMHSKGIYTRQIKHPVLQDLPALYLSLNNVNGNVRIVMPIKMKISLL